MKKYRFKKRKGFIPIIIGVLAFVALMVIILSLGCTGDRSGAGTGMKSESEEVAEKPEEPTGPIVPPSGPCAERIIKIAEEGVGAHEDPSGSNRSRSRNNPQRTQGITQDYKNGSRNADPWCAYFTSWVLRRAGEKMPVIACAASIGQYYLNKGQGFTAASVKAGKNTPQPGDIFVMGRGERAGGVPACGAGHVGIVRGYSNGTVLTYEGNVGRVGVVRAGSYPLSKLYWFGRPKCN